MTLGRGLDSLIPPQSDANPQGSAPVSGVPAPRSVPAPTPEQTPLSPAALPPAPPENPAEMPVPVAPPVAPVSPPAAMVPPVPPAPSSVLPAVNPHTTNFGVGVKQTLFPKEEVRGDEAIFHIEVEKIKPNPHQPRRHFDDGALHDLASSIREFGVIQPLIASKVQIETPMGTLVEYQLIAGERRLMAAKLAGLPRVPVIVRNMPLEQEKLEIAIIENLQREDLNPIENARAYAQLQDQFRLTQREIAVRLSKSRESIANTMRLLNLPTVIQDAIATKQIGESQGRLLLAVTDISAQQKLFEDLLHENFSVRELKLRINKANQSGQGAVQARMNLVHDPELQFLKDKLELVLGTPVSIQRNGPSGKIVIDFFSEEELRGIIERIKPEGGRFI